MAVDNEGTVKEGNSASGPDICSQKLCASFPPEKTIQDVRDEGLAGPIMLSPYVVEFDYFGIICRALPSVTFLSNLHINVSL